MYFSLSKLSNLRRLFIIADSEPVYAKRYIRLLYRNFMIRLGVRSFRHDDPSRLLKYLRRKIRASTRFKTGMSPSDCRFSLLLLPWLQLSYTSQLGVAVACQPLTCLLQLQYCMHLSKFFVCLLLLESMNENAYHQIRCSCPIFRVAESPSHSWTCVMKGRLDVSCDRAPAGAQRQTCLAWRDCFHILS